MFLASEGSKYSLMSKKTLPLGWADHIATAFFLVLYYHYKYQKKKIKNPQIKERLLLQRASLVNNAGALCGGDIVLFQVIFAQVHVHL